MPSQIDPTELAELLNQQGAALTLYAARWTDSPEDCVQEAFIELARQPEVPELPTAWLYRVVKLRALNAARGQRRRRDREREAYRQRLEASSGQTIATEQFVIVELLAQLEDDHQQIVTLRLWGQLTFEEIGQAMQLSTATAQRKYTLAIKHLQAAWPQLTGEELS